jgi:glycosyltransferase involved in cell wall biosynthesis
VKVLHLYSGNLYGGIERLLVTMARLRHLVPELEPEFALCFRGRVWDELTEAGVPVHDLGPVRFSRPWTLWRARRRLRQLLRQRNYAAVVCHACWPHAAFAATARAAGTRLVTWIHDALSGASWVERGAARTRPDLAIANSRFTAGTVAAVFPGVPVEVVYLPVEVTPVEDRETLRRVVRAELDTPADATVILQASRLERWKGPAVFVEALGRLRDVPGWVGWLAGGPQKAGEATFYAELQQRAAALGLTDRLRFLGQRTEVARLMAAADIYCQPNTGPEPFGLAFVEALASGLPVVSTAIGGACEIVDDSCGVLVPPNSAGAAADALRKLIADPSRRRTLGAAAPARASALCEPSKQLKLVRRALVLGASG